MSTDSELTAGWLSDEQLENLGRIKSALWKIEDAIKRINLLVIDSGLDIRPIPDLPLHLASNDLSRIVHAHEQAEKRICIAAFDAVEKHAA